MGKYKALGNYLFQIKEDQKSLRFSEIEAILGFTLPNSARKHRAWWGNDTTGNHVNAADGWLAAKWKVAKVDMKNETVSFTRSTKDLELKSEIQLQEKKLAQDDKPRLPNYEEIERLLDEFKEQKTELSTIRDNMNQLDGKINALLSGLADTKKDVENIRQEQSRLDESVLKKMAKLEHESRRSFEKTTGIAVMALVVGLFFVWFGAVSISTQNISPVYFGLFLLLTVSYVIAFVYWLWMNLKK